MDYLSKAVGQRVPPTTQPCNAARMVEPTSTGRHLKLEKQMRLDIELAYEFVRQGVWDEVDLKEYLFSECHRIFQHAWGEGVKFERNKGESK
jgi:hypothetical protein